ncbi:MAG: DUF4277 domain-containing protein, partial [Caldilinea sp.]|nr:DUF4277 domain-containing protein [Caldilinea sp.]
MIYVKVDRRNYFLGQIARLDKTLGDSYFLSNSDVFFCTRTRSEESIMAKRKYAIIAPQPEARRPRGLRDGQRTYRQEGKFIHTHQVGAVPVIGHILERMQLDKFFGQHIVGDRRDKISTSTMLLLLLNNLLVSREPMYGVVEWASNFGPWLFNLQPHEWEHLNDDRVGRDLERLFAALSSNLIMDVVTHVVQEFKVSLDEIHNDSTTISFHGAYCQALQEQQIRGQSAPAITWGHSKDHRPDPKQLLYTLT